MLEGQYFIWFVPQRPIGQILVSVCTLTLSVDVSNLTLFVGLDENGFQCVSYSLVVML
jgi:hypothetical protein